MSTDDPCFVPTKSSLLGGGKIHHESFVYTSYKSKKHIDPQTQVSKKETEHSSEEKVLNVKKLKQEVARFGMSGLAPKDEKEAMIQWAVKLGAKPPKNKCKNYKLLQEERKKDKERNTHEKQQFALRTQIQLKQTGKKRKTKSVTGAILGSYGKVDKDKVKAVKTK